MDISIEQKEQSINFEKWPIMTLSELYDQKLILNNRLEISYKTGNEIILNSLHKGLNDIEYFILIKLNEEYSSNKNKNIII